MIRSPATWSINGACQPPNGNPPSGASSGPPGACPARSRAANSSMWFRPIPCSREVGGGLGRAVDLRAPAYSSLRGHAAGPDRLPAVDREAESLVEPECAGGVVRVHGETGPLQTVGCGRVQGGGDRGPGDAQATGCGQHADLAEE